MRTCLCGCGGGVTPGFRYVNGHNMRTLPRSEAHREKIRKATQRRWDAIKAKHPGTKVCPICMQRKAIEEFGTRMNGRFLRSECRECGREKSRKWHKENIEKAHASVRRSAIRMTYGLSPEHYDQMLTAQHGKCAICGADRPDSKRKHMYVDHDHETGKVRGLLCGKCNGGLGMFCDSAELMQKAIEYLRFHSNKETVIR